MSTVDYPGPTEPMIGALLRRASEATHRELFARLQDAGFGDLRWAHFSLFGFPGLHGLRPTELAERVGLSKQGLNALLNDLTDFGYVIRRPASGDGRHRVLELTPRGLEFAAAMKRILQEIETGVAERIGQRQLDRLKTAAAAIAQLYPEPGTGRQDPTELRHYSTNTGVADSAPAVVQAQWIRRSRTRPAVDDRRD